MVEAASVARQGRQRRQRGGRQRRQGPRPGDREVQRVATALLAGAEERSASSLLGAARELAVALPRLATAPFVPVRVSSAATGDALRQALTMSAARHLLPRPLLGWQSLPASAGDYFTGRDRQQLRTGENNAARLGLTVVPVTSRAERRGATNAVLADRDRVPGDEWFLQYSEDEFWVCVDAAGAPVAIAAVCADDEAAYWRAALAVRDETVSSPARHLVHAAAVRSLIASGVRQLWCDSPLLTPAGLQRYQRNIGYQCATPVIRPPRSRRWSC